MNVLKLCPFCVMKYRESFTVTRLQGEAVNQKCDHCKKKTYVVKYEVSKK